MMNVNDGRNCYLLFGGRHCLMLDWMIFRFTHATKVAVSLNVLVKLEIEGDYGPREVSEKRETSKDSLSNSL